MQASARLLHEPAALPLGIISLTHVEQKVRKARQLMRGLWRRVYKLLSLLTIVRTHHDFSAVWQIALLLYRLSYRGSTTKSGCFILRAVTFHFQFGVHFATNVLTKKDSHFIINKKNIFSIVALYCFRLRVCLEQKKNAVC